ncbi:MAG: hypothetical protein IJL63_00360 [Clostridia bacterium]|nr:hypothetical protein [Clostridia bacterium]
MSVFGEIELRESTRKTDWACAILCIASAAVSIALFLVGSVYSVLNRSLVTAATTLLLSMPCAAFFSCAAVFNALRQSTAKRVMKAVTCAMSFLFIAGTLTAYLLFFPALHTATVNYCLIAALWIIAAAMIPLSIVLFNGTRRLRTALYLIITLFFTAAALAGLFSDGASRGAIPLLTSVFWLFSLAAYFFINRKSFAGILFYSLLFAAEAVGFIPLFMIIKGF